MNTERGEDRLIRKGEFRRVYSSSFEEGRKEGRGLGSMAWPGLAWRGDWEREETF